MARIKAHTTVRTTVGTFTSGDSGTIPDDEAERLEDAGLVERLDTDEDPSELAYNDLRSKVSDLTQTTDVKPDNYERPTLEEYVQRHG